MNIISRILWVALILIVAAGTGAIQLDRQSRYVPSVAGGVPEPVRAFAQRHIATAAIQGENKEYALEQARELVARRPMPAAHLRLLSLAEFEAGEGEASVLTIQRAARRGWRDPTAQEGMLRLALAAGDQTEAARRFAAIFVRARSEEGQLKSFGDQLFAEDSEEARATFAQIVTGADRWHRIYLRKGPVTIPTDAFLDITRRVVAQGVRFDCKQVDQAARRMRLQVDGAQEKFQSIFDEC